jgi:hypothetical protein
LESTVFLLFIVVFLFFFKFFYLKAAALFLHFARVNGARTRHHCTGRGSSLKQVDVARLGHALSELGRGGDRMETRRCGRGRLVALAEPSN